MENRVKITAGKWRGRPILFTPSPTLRPTGSRIRETLFNWLQGRLRHKTCLDVFAGSGILSFEALSRGAAHALVLDHDAAHIRNILMNAKTLEASVSAVHTDSLTWLQHNSWDADLVFLDPPFQEEAVLHKALALVATHITSKSYVYCESPYPLEIPSPLTALKQNRAGEVFYYLCQRS